MNVVPRAARRATSVAHSAGLLVGAGASAQVAMLASPDQDPASDATLALGVEGCGRGGGPGARGRG